jgi:signal transduction histidine kinase
MFVAYVVVFSGAALTCLGCVGRAVQVEATDLRRGLVALLVTSGLWAGMDLCFLVMPGMAGKEGLFIAGLTFGFATVWAWLYFCSAYAGRALHRSRAVWYLSAAVYLVVVAMKVTNPIHQLYFSLEPATEPFVHTSVEPNLLYWLVNGLSYLLAAGGYALLVPALERAGTGRRPIAVLVGLTALPVLLNVVGYGTPLLLEVNHDAVGVAAFAVGVLFVYAGSFEDVRRLSVKDEPAVIADESGQIRSFNAPAQALFPALRREKMQGRPLDEALPEVARALRAGRAIVQVPRSRNGVQRDYQITKSRFGAGLDRAGQLYVFTDVTAREQRRRDRDAQLRGLINSVPGVVFRLRVRDDGRYDLPFLSEAAADLLGLSPSADDLSDEERFDWLVRRVPDSHREELRASLDAAVETKAGWRFEVPYDPPEGERRWLLGTSVPQRRDDALCFDGVLIDITPRKEAEQKLRRQREELLAAKEEAEKASRLKSALLANMSHEVRTPLTSIIGFSEILAGMELGERPDRFVRLIHESGRRLMTTLNAVLDLSRLEAGAADLHVETVEVGAFLQEVAEAFAQEAETAGVALQVEPPAAGATLETDPGALRSILVNLVSNAVKFTGEGGRVTLRAREEGATSEFEDEAFAAWDVVFEVEDTGVGMDPSFIEDAFDAFRQESAGDDRAFEGSGLGLAIVDRYTDLLGGTVTIESEKGVGTVVRVGLASLV